MYAVIICCLYNTVSGQMVLLLLNMIWFDLIYRKSYPLPIPPQFVSVYRIDLSCRPTCITGFLCSSFFALAFFLSDFSYSSRAADYWPAP